MSYLIFIVAAGLFALLGAGGPLHRDNWFDALSRRVDAVELDLWPSLFLRVAAPLIGAGIVLLLLAVFLGELADALMGLALLYFAWGRGDYSTDLARFVARARVGDKEGADMLLTDNAPLARLRVSRLFSMVSTSALFLAVGAFCSGRLSISGVGQ